MRKAFNEYKLYVFDLDGTLYNQPRLRRIMAIRLIKYYLLHPFSIMELYHLYKFRNIKDKWDEISDKPNLDKTEDLVKSDARIGSMDILVCDYMAGKAGVKASKLYDIVYRWIYENPLTALNVTKDENLSSIIKGLRDTGKQVVIFSDYPVEDKLGAMGITVDGMYCSADDSIGEYKPSPKGLQVIMNDYNMASEDIIMIGDRQEKDGVSSQRADIDYIILPRDTKKRNYDCMK